MKQGQRGQDEEGAGNGKDRDCAKVLLAGSEEDGGGQDLAPLPESWVTVCVEGKPVGFMVGTGAQYSVMNQAMGKLKPNKTSLVQGATGWKIYPWTSNRQVHLGKHQVTHSFLVVPDSPVPLLGRDLLTKVRARIHFDPDGIKVMDGEGTPQHVLTSQYMMNTNCPESRGRIVIRGRQWHIG